MILITGATGHIGNVLVKTLYTAGQKLRVLLLPGEEFSPLAGLDVEFVYGNVLDMGSLEQAMQGVDQVYHLAGLIYLMPGNSDQVQAVNVTGTKNVVLAAQKCGVRRLLYTSSIHAIREAPHGTVIDENQPFDPTNPRGAYDRSKAEASLVVMDACQNGLEAVIVCPTGVIGPYDYRGSEVGRMIQDYCLPKPQFCIAGAYDFVDVRDVANGMILAMQKGQAGKAYILSGERISVTSLVRLIRELTGIRPFTMEIPLWIAQAAASLAPWYYRLTHSRPIFTPYTLATLTSNSVISSARARRDLGFTSRPVAESLADTIRWIAAQDRSFWKKSR